VFWNRLHRGDRIVVRRRDGHALEVKTCAGAWDTVHHTNKERSAVTATLVN